MGLFAAVAWNSRSRLGGLTTGSGASYLSGTGSAQRFLGTCATPLLRLCQSHGCREAGPKLRASGGLGKSLTDLLRRGLSAPRADTQFVIPAPFVSSLWRVWRAPVSDSHCMSGVSARCPSGDGELNGEE